MTLKALNIWLVFMLISLCASITYSHDSRPIYVEINEPQAAQFNVQWKAPVSIAAFALPALLMPKNCVATGKQRSGQYADAFTMSQAYHCPNGISGQTLTLHYPNNNPSLSTLFRLNLHSGEQHTKILSPAEKHWLIPLQASPWQVSKQYTALGFQHIFAGIDHLLFIACLWFIAAGFKRLLITLTGFTLAHSLTLALSALNLVSLPIVAVEAVIALSIVFLAHEIALNNQQSWTWRYPILVSSSFGLLHGFGFAAALTDIGLPQTELGAALIAFNVGVELGQIVFIVGLSAIVLAVTRVRVTPPWSASSNRIILSYAIGTLASYWLIERILLF